VRVEKLFSLFVSAVSTERRIRQTTFILSQTSSSPLLRRIERRVRYRHVPLLLSWPTHKVLIVLCCC